MKTTIKINPTKNEEGIFTENIIIFHASKSYSSDLFLNDDEKEYVQKQIKDDKEIFIPVIQIKVAQVRGQTWSGPAYILINKAQVKLVDVLDQKDTKRDVSLANYLGTPTEEETARI